MKIMKFVILILWWCLVLSFSTTSFSQTKKLYSVVRVSDGDTIVVTDGHLTFRVRLASLDAPEKSQPFSKLATQTLRKKIQGQKVEIFQLTQKQDRYGRILARVILNQQDIALFMIEEGLATYYRPSCQDYPVDAPLYNYQPEIYVSAEKQARKLKKAMWSEDKIVLPCEYRRQKKK